jgi:lysophospholipase L1-like esterase
MFSRSRSNYTDYGSSSYLFNSGYNRKPKFPWLKKVLPIAIPAGILLLELLLRLGVGVVGKGAEIDRFQGESPAVTDYRLHWLDAGGQPIDGLPNRGRLAAKRSDLLGYRLVANQTKGPIAINAQGFRNSEPIEPTKPKDQLRIVVLGGSMAFGQLSSSNTTTFSNSLEQRLNQQVEEQRRNPTKFRPDVLPYFADDLVKAEALPPKIRSGQYKVINAAVPGYSAANELAQLVQLLAYQPDWVIVVDGYGDLLLPETQQAAAPPVQGLLAHSLNHWLGAMQQDIGHRLGQLYLVKVPQYWLFKPQNQLHWSIPLVDGSLASQLPDAKTLEPRLGRYRQSLDRMAQILTAAKVPVILALQPEVSQRPEAQRGTTEKAIVQQLGRGYVDRIGPAYGRLSAIHRDLKGRYGGLTTIDLNQGLAKQSGEAFVDPIHLTDAANGTVAAQIYDQLAPALQVQSKPFVGDQPPVSGF